MKNLKVKAAAVVSALGINFAAVQPASSQTLPSSEIFSPEMRGLILSPHMMAQAAPPTSRYINENVCEKDLPETLAYRDAHRFLFSDGLKDNYPSNTSNPEDVQVHAQNLLDERRMVYELIFNCDADNRKLNGLALALKQGSRDQDVMTELQTLVIVKHYAALAGIYTPQYFKQKAANFAMFFIGTQNRKFFEDNNIELDMNRLQKAVESEIAKNHERLVKHKINENLETLFGIQPLFPKTHPQYQGLPIEKMMQNILAEAVKTEMQKKSRPPLKEPFRMPYQDVQPEPQII